MKYCMHCMQALVETDTECPFCGNPISVACQPHHLIPGTVLYNKFLVGKVIGQGGFGITYIGRDLKLNIRVAIKEYYPNGYVGRSNNISLGVNCNTSEGDEAFYEKGRERFLREAQILAKFSDAPGIVSVRDFFEENNTVYIVMEYLEGENLKEYLKKKGTISVEKTIQMMMPVMESLEKIHEQGLIHRDISPDNICLSGKGVKLLDFGAARTVSAISQKSLSVMLKPGYAPYEQYFSTGEQGYWTDVYSICATMYKCITGITPEEAPARMAADKVRTPSALGVAILPAVEKALMKGLSVQVKDRYQSMTELMQGLNGMEDTGYEGVTVMNPSTELRRREAELQPVYEEVPEVSANQAETQEEKKEKLPVVEKTKTKKEKKSKKEKIKKVAVKKDRSERRSVKTLLLILLAVIVLLGITLALFFALNSGFGGLKSAKQVKISPTPAGISPTSTATNEIYVQGELFDFKFALDDTVYQLPMTYQAFVDEGWKLDNEFSKTDLLSGNSYSTVKFSKGNSRVSVDIMNIEKEAQELKDCLIYGIKIYESEVQNFAMVKGITFGSTQYKIKNIFGTPNIDQDYMFTYEKDGDQKVTFVCYSSTGALYYVYFQCYGVSEEK